MDFPNVDNLWLFYYENSKLTEFSNIPIPNEQVIEISKSFAPSLTIEGKRFQLTPAAKAEADMYQVMKDRASRATPSLRGMTFEELSNLLYYAYGSKQTSTGKSAMTKRNAPSAGGLYPIELFFFAREVEQIPDGLYYFDSPRNEIVLFDESVNYKAVADCYVSDDPILNKNLIFFFCPIFNKSIFKYHNRGFRFVFMEAGHIAQNLLLVATGLERQALPVCGYFEYKVDQLLRLDGHDFSCVYTVAVG
ncbi:MAG: SagB/ThcOx family dehydrogenase [Cyanothece sp. SIO1E1]|nr:SagB/ThcOx family dehydrogenase [Cyanothece sp. SIO1E1]